MNTPTSVMERLPEEDRVCAFCRFISSDCESEGRKCCNLSDDYTENYFELDSPSDYSDCNNCKYQDTETCQFCRRHYDDMWEAQ